MPLRPALMLMALLLSTAAVEAAEPANKGAAGKPQARSLPASFPKDVWLPASYTVASAKETKESIVVRIVSPGKLVAVATTADLKMKAQGWRPAVTLPPSATGGIAVYSKDARHATLAFGKHPNGVSIGYDLSRAGR